MNLNAIIASNYQKWQQKIVQCGIPEGDALDVLHSVILSLYERNLSEEYIRNIDTYIVSACRIAYFSPNSPYRKQYGREVPVGDDIDCEAVIDDDCEEEELDIWTEIETAPFSWWEKEAFKRKILEDKTLQEIADESNLSLGQVYYSFCKVKNYLKNKLK